jgi:hypothetical protein
MKPLLRKRCGQLLHGIDEIEYDSVQRVARTAGRSITPIDVPFLPQRVFLERRNSVGKKSERHECWTNHPHNEGQLYNAGNDGQGMNNIVACGCWNSA